MAKLPVYWAPWPGKQALAATCPADEILFGGTRGGGKSDTAIGRQIRGATKHGIDWRGLMARKKYKDLGDIKRKFDALILRGMPAERIGGEAQTNIVRFTGGPAKGAEIYLTAFQHVKQLDDWQGFEFCVVEGTPVRMGDGTSKKIEDIRAGDVVSTLEGPRKVTATWGSRVAECVEVRTKFGSQRQPVDHPILTASGWLSYASIQDAYSRATVGTPQESQQCPYVSGYAVLHRPSLGQQQRIAPIPIEFDDLGKLDRQLIRRFRETSLAPFCSASDLPRPLEHSVQGLDFGALVYVTSSELRDLEAIPGSQFYYPLDYYFYDEPSLPEVGIYQGDIPSPNDAALPSRTVDDSADVLDSTPVYSLVDELRYVHFYTGTERVATEESIFAAFVISPPMGKFRVYDITVDEVNHYLTDCQGFVNCNCEVTIDEAPQMSYIATVIDKMRGTLRSKKNIHTTMFLTGNPGGPGASALKILYKLNDPMTWGKIQNIEVKFDLGDEEVTENITRVYLHSILEDNAAIDPREYKKKLAVIGDPALLAAWLRGDWTVTIGQAFFIDPARHAIEPIWPIPEYAPIYMTFDWGYGAPFSIGWWWADQDNRVYRFAEWYGWDGKTPNRGLRITDREIADGILSRERDMGIGERKIDRIAGPDSFRKKPNYLGGGQGPSTADEFKDYAESSQARDKYGKDIDLRMRPGDADRAKKLRQFRNRLAIPSSRSEMPMLVVYNTCKEWLRTIPSVSLDEDNIEVIEEGQEDHAYDESCHVCMARPINVNYDSISHEASVQGTARAVGGLDSASRAAAQELFIIKKKLAEGMSTDSGIILDPRSVGLLDADFDDDLVIDADELFRAMPSLKHLFQ